MGEPEVKGIFGDAGNEPAAGFDFNAVKGEISGDFPAFVRQNFRSIYLKKNLVFPLKLKSGGFIILSTHLTKSDTIKTKWIFS